MGQEIGLVPKLWAALQAGSPQAPLTEQESAKAATLAYQALNIPTPDSLAPSPGQAFRLDLIEAMSKHLTMPDTTLLPLLRTGVPTGALSPLPSSHQWTTASPSYNVRATGSRPKSSPTWCSTRAGLILFHTTRSREYNLSGRRAMLHCDKCGKWVAMPVCRVCGESCDTPQALCAHSGSQACLGLRLSRRLFSWDDVRGQSVVDEAEQISHD